MLDNLFRMALFACGLLFLVPLRAQDTKLDIERFKSLREAERYQMELAGKQFKAGQWEAAINEFGKFLKLHQDSDSCSYAQHMVGVSYENNRYVNEAFKQYQKVLDYYPNSPEAPYAVFRMSQCHFKSGDMDMGREGLLKIVSNKAYAGHSLVAEVLWQLSDLAAGGEKPRPDLVIEYRKRIVLEYQQQNPNLYNRSVDWLARNYATQEDDPVSAREMILRYPGMTREEAEMWMADRYLEAANARRDSEEGKKFRQKARDIWSHFHEKFPNATSYAKRCLLSHAQSYRDEGNANKALELYALYLNQWPNDDGARNNIAYYLGYELKRWNDARLEYTKLQDKMLGQWQIAESYRYQGAEKADDAIAGFQKVIDTDFVRYAQGMYHMAWVYYHHKGDFEKAMKLYMESNYSPPEHLFRVAECLIALKRYEPAVKQYAEIISFFKESAPRAYLAMGDAYLNYLKKQDDAVKVYRIVCRQFPRSSEASQAHLRLENLGVVITEGGVEKEKE
ncbi:MAG: tetratricopeptide repeat protein [Planctomycetes bacterium]|nr:tetratricopeptide repeat protein [Planctomycetota bacterium]